MNAVIIGPSDRSSLWRHGSLKEEEYTQFIDDYAHVLAKNFDNVIITPDNGVFTDVADAFTKAKGKKAIAFYPDTDTFYAYEHLKPNFPKYEVKPIEGDWYKLNADLTKKANIIICLGFSPGTLIEIAFIKYHQKYGGRKDASLKNIHLFIDERCTGEKLHETFHEQIQHIQYYNSLEALQTLIDHVRA